MKPSMLRVMLGRRLGVSSHRITLGVYSGAIKVLKVYINLEGTVRGYAGLREHEGFAEVLARFMEEKAVKMALIHFRISETPAGIYDIDTMAADFVDTLLLS